MIIGCLVESTFKVAPTWMWAGIEMEATSKVDSIKSAVMIYTPFHVLLFRVEILKWQRRFCQ